MPYLLALVGILVLFVPMIYAALIAAPPLSTLSRDTERLIRLARIQPGQRVVDLGAGYGQLMTAAAKAHPDAEIIGYEISPLHFWLVQCRLWLRGHAAHARVRYQNFFNADLRDADVILMFLMEKGAKRLAPKLEAELKPGARVVSYIFPVPGWEATAVDRPQQTDYPIYVYQR